MAFPSSCAPGFTVEGPGFTVELPGFTVGGIIVMMAIVIMMTIAMTMVIVYVNIYILVQSFGGGFQTIIYEYVLFTSTIFITSVDYFRLYLLCLYYISHS